MTTLMPHPQMALTAEMRTEGGWLSWSPLTVAWRNCWMSSGDMAAVKRLAAHRARPKRNGEAAEKRTKSSHFSFGNFPNKYNNSFESKTF